MKALEIGQIVYTIVDDQVHELYVVEIVSRVHEVNIGLSYDYDDNSVKHRRDITQVFPTLNGLLDHLRKDVYILG